MPTDPQRTGLAMVFLATVGLSLKSVLAKLAFATGMPVDGLLAWRMLFALPVFVAGAAILRRGAAVGVGPRDYAGAVAVGGFLLLAMVCDLEAIERIGAGLSRIILFTFPMIIVLIEAVRRLRPPPPARLGGIAVAYAGLALALWPQLGGSHDAAFVEGVFWAFGSAVAYAVYLLGGQRFTRTIGTVRFTAVSNFGVVLGGVALMPWWFAPSDLSASPDGLALAALLAVVSTALPYFLLFEGVRRFGAERAGLVSLMGPALTVLLAWVFLGESQGPVQITGLALVMAGIAGIEGALPRFWARTRSA